MEQIVFYQGFFLVRHNVILNDDFVMHYDGG